MSEVPAAVGFDRLPWLADDHQPRAARSPRRRESGSPRRNEWRVREWLGWAVAALLMVAGASYWLGVRSAAEAPVGSGLKQPSLPVTVPLPAPRQVKPVEPPQLQAPQVEIEPAPQVAPVAAPPAPVKVAAPPKVRAARARPAPAKAAAPPALWPVRVEAGASGRMVRIGTFATRRQAKRGWARIMRIYPGMSRLPALVVPQPSLRDGRTYYRLQMGTTSQAHSEVLCQRMRIIAQSCVVVDLPASARAKR